MVIFAWNITLISERDVIRERYKWSERDTESFASIVEIAIFSHPDNNTPASGRNDSQQRDRISISLFSAIWDLTRSEADGGAYLRVAENRNTSTRGFYHA